VRGRLRARNDSSHLDSRRLVAGLTPLVAENGWPRLFDCDWCRVAMRPVRARVAAQTGQHRERKQAEKAQFV
jgi:hypothetical protein